MSKIKSCETFPVKLFSCNGAYWAIERLPSLYLDRATMDDCSISTENNEEGGLFEDGRKYKPIMKLACESGSVVKNRMPGMGLPAYITIKRLQELGFLNRILVKGDNK